jgi:hemoglobin-like flavoprotein
MTPQFSAGTAVTRRERELVRESFPALREEAGPLSLLFYGRLFAQDPQLRLMFHGDIARQGLKLMEMLAAVVDSLDQMDTLNPLLQAMGQRHTAYGVVPSHYQGVEEALVWAAGQVLGESSDSEVVKAWRSVIREVSSVMQAGADQLNPAPQ